MPLLLAPAPCSTVTDIAAAIARARAEDAELALDLSALDGVYINPLRRIAWVQPGATWAQLDAATQEHGLAVTGARDPEARVGDTTVGTGSGWLERKLGLSSDSLRAVRVMTADGVVVAASERENADLFWALRGGGGGSGVVVELEFALRPVGPELLGGVLQWPRERAGDVARAYRDLMADAPDALCGGLLLSRAATGVLFLYAGEPERGAYHLAALRALLPASDGVAVRPYVELQAILPGGEPTGYLDALPDAAIDAMVAEGGDVLLQPLGGAYARHGELETAARHRDAQWAYRSQAGTPALWARPAGDAERDARLRAIRRRWDPCAVFGG